MRERERERESAAGCLVLGREISH